MTKAVLGPEWVEAFDGLQRDGVIKSWSCRHKSRDVWTISLHHTEPGTRTRFDEFNVTIGGSDPQAAVQK